MNVSKIVSLASKGVTIGKKLLVDNAPIILAIKGATGVISTSILTAKATVKAVDDVRNVEMVEARCLTWKEKFKLCYKYYIPPAIDGIASIACIGGSNYIYLKKNIRLATTLVAYEELIDNYKNKIAAQFGEEFSKEVANAITEPKQVQKDVQASKDPIISLNKDMAIASFNASYMPDKVICMEPYTNQYFVSSRAELEYIENHIQGIHLKNAGDFCETTMNDAFYEINLPQSKILEHWGWRFEDCRVISLSFHSTLLDDKYPAMVIEFDPEPYYLD